jgi:hypothetical protein
LSRRRSPPLLLSHAGRPSGEVSGSLVMADLVVGRLGITGAAPLARGCSFGLAPVLMRVRCLHGEQLTPPARACSTPRARERTHLRLPLRARHLRALSGHGRRCKVGRSLDGIWTRHRPSPNGHRTTRRVSAVSVHRRRTRTSLRPRVPVDAGWVRQASWHPRHARTNNSAHCRAGDQARCHRFRRRRAPTPESPQKARREYARLPVPA